MTKNGFEMNRNGLILLLTMMVALTANARTRTVEEMRQAAAQVLCRQTPGGLQQVPGLIKVLQRGHGLVVMGYENSSFAVMAEDDNYPEVLGYSDTPFQVNTRNQNFRWWLSQVEEMVSRPANAPIRAIRPDTTRFAAKIEPMMQTKWDQTNPYNLLCPQNCPTGCVATAAAQVLRYNEWPQYGQGTVYTYFPYGDFDGMRLEVNIEGVEYQYDQMLNTYTSSSSSKQMQAVATLMYHVGLAMKAQYEQDGTGSYNEPLTYGLRNHLGYPYAVTIDKDNYTAQEWMEMIFETISNGHPIIYGGSDDTYTGHEFVLHGYDSSGRIFINWGWSGEEDGYFDLSSLLLYWGIYNFNSYQNMILRVDKASLTADTVSIDVETPGTLDQLLGERRNEVVCLKVNGAINSSDLKTLRSMAGCSVTGKGTLGSLSVLDMSGATIVAGGEPYLIEDQYEYTTEDDAMPDKAFAGCAKLISVVLPEGLQHYGTGVFAGCNNLDTVTLSSSEESDFVVDGCYVLNKERTELIEALPTDNVHYEIPYGVTWIHDEAFAGRYLYERLSLPETVDTIGKKAFNRCFDLCRTYVYSKVPPRIDPTAIDDLDLSIRTLYVPQGTLFKYSSATGWKKYGIRHTKEFKIADNIIQTYAQEDAAADLYDLSGKIVKTRAGTTEGLRKGMYVTRGRKHIVR